MRGQTGQYRITGARVLRDQGWCADPVSVAEGQIEESGGPDLDLSGYSLFPGAVDVSCRVPQNWPVLSTSTIGALQTRLRAYEQSLIEAGITTGWIAQDWGLSSGSSSPDGARTMAAALEMFEPRARLDLRLRLRVETHMPDAASDLLAFIRRYGVDYATLYSEISAPGFVGAEKWPLDPSPSPEKTYSHRRAVAEAASSRVPRHLCRLAEAFETLGVHYGSHGDEDAETREFYSMIGARVAEFPKSRRAAATAQAMGDPVILAAPDVPRGAGPGRSTVLELVSSGIGDALASRNHPASLLHAAWTLSDLGVLDIASAWSMISARPARILGLRDRGRIAPGLRADFVLIDHARRRVAAVVVAGRVIFAEGDTAQRLAPIIPLSPLAAE